MTQPELREPKSEKSKWDAHNNQILINRISVCLYLMVVPLMFYELWSFPFAASDNWWTIGFIVSVFLCSHAIYSTRHKLREMPNNKKTGLFIGFILLFFGCYFSIIFGFGGIVTRYLGYPHQETQYAHKLDARYCIGSELDIQFEDHASGRGPCINSNQLQFLPDRFPVTAYGNRSFFGFKVLRIKVPKPAGAKNFKEEYIGG